jgi:acyl-CoA thioesterase FadM
MNLYLRFFWNLMTNLIFRPKADIFDECELTFRVLPNDLDTNMHMNNGRYLSIMDIGRIDHSFKTGVSKLMLKNKWGGVTAGINISYFKELKPFEKYRLKTRLLGWDENWFYIEHRFMKGELIAAKAIAKGTFTQNRKKINTGNVVKIIKGENFESPEFPQFLKELIVGESHMVEKIRDHNREVRNKLQ